MRADALDVDDLLESATRCPHCSASVRPGAPWCTLCHADLRPPPPPPPPPVIPRPSAPAVASYGGALDPLTAPAAALGLPPRAGSEPTWPCSTCGCANEITSNACSACGAAFLSSLRIAEAGPLLELPGIGDITRLSRAQRMLLALGVVVAFLAVVAMLSLLAS